jgi:hypothetical protein
MGFRVLEVSADMPRGTFSGLDRPIRTRCRKDETAQTAKTGDMDLNTKPMPRLTPLSLTTAQVEICGPKVFAGVLLINYYVFPAKAFGVIAAPHFAWQSVFVLRRAIVWRTFGASG